MIFFSSWRWEVFWKWKSYKPRILVIFVDSKMRVSCKAVRYSFHYPWYLFLNIVDNGFFSGYNDHYPLSTKKYDGFFLTFHGNSKFHPSKKNMMDNFSFHQKLSIKFNRSTFKNIIQLYSFNVFVIRHFEMTCNCRHFAQCYILQHLFDKPAIAVKL